MGTTRSPMTPPSPYDGATSPEDGGGQFYSRPPVKLARWLISM
jgi:hypothetical protein